MTLYTWVVSACWVVFIIYWIVAAVGSKKTLNSFGVRSWFVSRIVLVVVLVLAFSNQAVRDGMKYQPGVATPGLAALGALLAIIGIGLAVWARTYLGRNWGMPQSVKEKPELVTTGPYSYIRHPIYTGVLLAMLGTGLATSALWFLIFVIGGGYFIYSAFQEEKLMVKTFPDTYPAYKARTKMLIPFISVSYTHLTLPTILLV